MDREQLDKIVDQVAAEGKIHGIGLSHTDLIFVVEHFDEFREWADNERRIARLQAELRSVNATRDSVRESIALLLPKVGGEELGWNWRDEASVRLLVKNGATEDIKRQAAEELKRRGIGLEKGERRFTKRPTTEGDLR